MRDLTAEEKKQQKAKALRYKKPIARDMNLDFIREKIVRTSTSHTNGGKPISQHKRPNWCPLSELPDIAELGDCNRCMKKDCKYVPDPGQLVRYNCPFYEGKQEKSS